MLGYLSADIICFEKRTVFRERSSRKTVSYEEQIMSKDKYPSIFSPQMEAIDFIILQIFLATCAIFKIEEYSRVFPSFSWRIFGHVTRLDQSHARQKIWWIIINNIPRTCVGYEIFLHAANLAMWLANLAYVVDESPRRQRRSRQCGTQCLFQLALWNWKKRNFFDVVIVVTRF